MLWRSLHQTSHFRSQSLSRLVVNHPRRNLRYASSASDASLTRNLAIVAHIDSGKTTLTESVLARSGYLSAAGTVDTGSTTTDFLPAERERGITIQSASIPVSWKDWTYNLIDTPGHADFGMEVESASRVVDGAVVLIDSVEGVESQTQGVWKQLERYGVPSKILFLNKMDRPGASFRASIQSILNYRLHPRPIAITLPVASFDPLAYSTAEPGVEGIIDLVRWELWKWDNSQNAIDSGENFTRQALPTSEEEMMKSEIFHAAHPLRTELIPARRTMLDNLSMHSEELMDTLLELSDASDYANVPAEQIISALRNAVLQREILPVLCGSAMKHIGTDLVLDYAGLLLASPLDVPGAIALQDSSDAQMLAWKVTWDKRRGWMTFIRIYSGSLSRQSALFNVTRNQKEKVSKLMLFYASQPEEVEMLHFGNVGVILGLKHTRTGDTLVATGSHYVGRSKLQQQNAQADATALRGILPPPAVMALSVIPQSTADLQPVHEALLALSRTDPSARVEAVEGQLLVHGLGSLHLEIIESRLRDEWGVAFETGRRRVTFRESLPEGYESVTEETWRTDVGGRSIEVKVKLNVRSLDVHEAGDSHWDGNLVVGESGEPIPPPAIEGSLNPADKHNPMVHAAQGLASSLLSSPHSGLAYSRIAITLHGFELNPVDAHVSTIAGATSYTLRKAFLAAGRGPLLEPYVNLRISVGEEYIGRVVKDLTENGGEIVDLGAQSVDAVNEDDGVPYPSDGVYLPPAWMSPSAFSEKAERGGSGMKRNIRATAPLSKMLDFNNRLRALSGGHGTFEMSSAGFKVVGQAREMEILREIGRA